MKNKRRSDWLDQVVSQGRLAMSFVLRIPKIAQTVNTLCHRVSVGDEGSEVIGSWLYVMQTPVFCCTYKLMPWDQLSAICLSKPHIWTACFTLSKEKQLLPRTNFSFVSRVGHLIVFSHSDQDAHPYRVKWERRNKSQLSPASNRSLARWIKFLAILFYSIIRVHFMTTVSLLQGQGPNQDPGLPFGGDAPLTNGVTDHDWWRKKL